MTQDEEAPKKKSGSKNEMGAVEPLSLTMEERIREYPNLAWTDNQKRAAGLI